MKRFWYHRIRLTDPPLARFLFGDTHASWLWLVVRLYIAQEWLTAGWGKVTSAAWTGASAGTALTGFVNAALAKLGGAHPEVQGWYGAFLRDVVLPHAAIWGKVVAFGELAVGLGLLLGAFTGIAAFFGLFMNFNFLLAGTVSVNPILMLLSVLLVLAWKNAGYVGADRWLLPRLGVPWHTPN